MPNPRLRGFGKASRCGISRGAPQKSTPQGSHELPRIQRLFLLHLPTTQKAISDRISPFLVDGGGFEPPKAELADLQSAPFGHSGTRPNSEANGMELEMGVEPATY